MYVISYLTIPWGLAFYDRLAVGWIIYDSILDLIFVVNIVYTFFRAYYNEYYILVDRRRDIALNYLKFWFWVDVAAIIPLYAFIDMRDYNALFRMLRLWKLPGVINLQRVFNFNRIKFSIQFERSLGLLFAFVLFCHISACVWIMIGQMSGPDGSPWILAFDVQNKNNVQLYIISLYFIMTTYSTEGYGDYIPATSFERVVVILFEIFGVLCFSYAISSVTNIIEKQNDFNKDLQQKLDRLDDIKRNYKMSVALYDVAKQSLIYQSKQDKIDSKDLLKSFPYSLQTEMSSNILKDQILKNFSNGKEPTYLLGDVIPKLSAFTIEEGEFIYREGDEAE